MFSTDLGHASVARVLLPMDPISYFVVYCISILSIVMGCILCRIIICTSSVQ